MRIWDRWPRWLRVVAVLVLVATCGVTLKVMHSVIRPSKVTLEIRTEPPGAEVWVGGRNLGASPVRVDVTEQLHRYFHPVSPGFDEAGWEQRFMSFLFGDGGGCLTSQRDSLIQARWHFGAWEVGPVDLEAKFSVEEGRPLVPLLSPFCEISGWSEKHIVIRIDGR